jgi:hypothetical protein
MPISYTQFLPASATGAPSVMDGSMWFTERAVTIAKGATDKALFRTGAKAVLMEQREFRFNGLGVTFGVYKAPTVTATGAEALGTAFNATSDSATKLFKLFPLATTTGDGVLVSPLSSIGGSVGTWNKQTAFPIVLQANTDYLFVTTNLDANGGLDIRVRACFIETDGDVSPYFVDGRLEL